MTIRYSDEFKRDAVALVAAGSTQKQVCRDLGISKSALAMWVQNSKLGEYGIDTPVDPDERRRQLTLMRRLEELELENEILRKAAAYLSQANLKHPK